MWYVYIIKSLKDKDNYVGLTNDLVRRIKHHNNGEVYSTRLRKPFKLIYYEAHHSKYDAAKREQFLKSGWGKNWIKNNLKDFLKSQKLGG